MTKGTDSDLCLRLNFDGKAFNYSFGKDTTKSIATLENNIPPPRNSNSVFLPAKELLSLHDIILKSRQQDQVFGFDDTYYDLAMALSLLPAGGKNFAEFAQARKALENIINGRVEYDDASSRWQFKRGNQKFPIGVTAEGVKKIGILDTLLRNCYLDMTSVIFMDEPESALHPKAISQLLDIIANLAGAGIQFFLASHSYFVVKKLYLIAQEKQLSIPVMSLSNKGLQVEDLKNGMPDNPIIDESIRLYKEEVELALK